MGATNQLLSFIMLRTEMRDYFIRKVKDPLRKTLVAIANRIPEITRENTRHQNTHTLMGIFERFLDLQDESPKKDMFRAAFTIFLMEIEHDVYYRDRFGWLMEELLKAILRGEIEERTNGQPERSWKEEGQRGGKYSLIQIIQNKERFLSLMGDNWKYKGD